MAIKISGNTVIDDNQNIISSGIATATNFKTGTTDVHSLGIEVAGINVLGADTPIGSNATIYDNGNATFAGNVTASAFLGDGSSLTGLFSGSYTDLSNKPDLSQYITNSGGTTGATANTVVKRDSSADIHCRLLRPNFSNENTISGAIAFRINSGSNNYVRFCSSPSAVRAWLGAGTSSFDGNYNNLSNKPSIPTHTSHLTNNSGYITSSSLPTHTSHLTNNSGYITADGGNAATLDGIDSSQFLRSDADDNTTGKLVIGGTYGNNAYSSVSSTRLLFGGGDSDAQGNYYIGTNKENYGGNYTKLDLRWHTGIRIGAQTGYGGTRIYDSEDLSTLLFSVGKGDGHTRVESGNLYVQGNLAWHQGNDGSGSGLDADLLDGIDSSRFLRSDAADTSSQRISFQANATNNWDTIATSGGSQGSIEVYNSGAGNDAFMSFHTGGDYAIYFGLDADTNDLSVGGWSMGANKYRVWHAGNDGSGTGLDADLLDGQQGSYYSNYNNLSNKPSIPTHTSHLTNNSGFLTSIPSTVVQYNAWGNVNISGIIQGKSFRCRAGENGAVQNTFNIEWSPGRHGRLWIGTSDVGQIYLSSDYRLKRNITPMSNGALDRIKMVNPVSYQWDDFERDGVELSTASEEINEGFIAHELQQIIPSAVDGEKDDPITIQSLKPDAIMAVAVKAIQELSAKNDALEARIAQLESN